MVMLAQIKKFLEDQLLPPEEHSGKEFSAIGSRYQVVKIVCGEMWLKSAT